jgi:nucleotide-binding universal stress UspA family protein
MGSYLVVMDGTEEARIALRYAARQAALSGGAVDMLAVVTPQEFVQWGAVQEAMEEEARLRAEAMLLEAADSIVEEAGLRPSVIVKHGEPVKTVAELLKERGDITALVLATGESGPGPLVSHFSGAAAGGLPCPLIIVPAKLRDEALARAT